MISVKITICSKLPFENNLYRKAISDTAYSQGKSLTSQTVWNVVQNAFNNGSLPADPNAIYLVLSSRY
jgi:hypothetical protein